MNKAQAICGLHGPNRRLADVPGGAEAFWQQTQAARCSWTKLLYPDHTRADAKRAKELGLRVIVRAPGEGVVHIADVLRIIREFEGVCDLIEVGNEPPVEPTALWVHAWYLDAVINGCHYFARNAGIQLLAPGWKGNDEPLAVDNSEGLRDRLFEVYNKFDAISCHAYGEHVLEWGQVQRIQRWAAAFPGKPLHVTEAGIAAKDLIAVPPTPFNHPLSRIIKARRYAKFLYDLADHVPAVQSCCFFIGGGATPEWDSFDGDTRGYTLPLDAWAELGERIKV